jgi:hypothetical protein
MTVQRYEWEDLLIEAAAVGRISEGYADLARRLARPIHWNPKDGKPAGLYWKNEWAMKSVGSSMPAYYRMKRELAEAGFFTMIRGNLIPTLPPDLEDIHSEYQAFVETITTEEIVTSDSEDDESTDDETITTDKETITSDDAFIISDSSELSLMITHTVDTYSEDSLSGDSSSKPAPLRGLAVFQKKISVEDVSTPSPSTDGSVEGSGIITSDTPVTDIFQVKYDTGPKTEPEPKKTLDERFEELGW